MIQVIYQDKSTAAVAREVQGEERQAIWERARQIYGGYEAYARRIKGRPIHIMLLSTQAPAASDPGSDLSARGDASALADLACVSSRAGAGTPARTREVPCKAGGIKPRGRRGTGAFR